jgi:MYXO-CTERM domain-containing protein
MRVALSVSIAGVLLAAAPAARGDVSQSLLVGDPNPADGRPRPSFIVQGPIEPLPPPVIDDSAHAAPKIFFLNKNGGTYTPGNNDARTNRSSIVGQTRSVPAWNVSASGWSQVMTCMTTMFSRWNVVITDVDPGNVPHWELVVAGRPQDIGMQAGIGGVSPFNCSTINNSIVFTFAEVYGTAYRDICETNAQEIAHSFGLDHERLCADPMTYLTGCGNKSFQNTAAPCGEYTNRPCMCGGSTQNSVALLDQRLGLYEAPAVDAGVDAPIDAPIDAPAIEVDAADPEDPDAASNPGDSDAGMGGESQEISGGCACDSGGAPPASSFFLVLAVLALLQSRSRRSGRRE